MADPAVQRFLLRRVLSLPPAALRALSGGGVVHRGGRTLDPRFQYLWKAWTNPGAMETLSPDEARIAWAELIATAGPERPRTVKAETLLLDGPGGTLTCCLHRPSDHNGAPMIVFLHDGGWVAGGVEESQAIASILAEATRTAVLVPEYRRAPEHRFPAAFEDAMAAVRWAREAGGRYGCAEDDVTVAGLSNGAGMAAAVCLELKRAGEPQPRRQVLVTPILDAAGEGQSMNLHADAWPMSVEALRWVMRHYLGPEADPADLRLSPFRARDLAGLAPAVIVAAGFDPVADQAEAYARKLQAAGVPVTFRLFDALPHSFPQFGGLVPAADTAWRAVGRLARIDSPRKNGGK